MIKTIIFDLGEVLVSDAVIYYLNNLADFTDVLELAGITREKSKEIWSKYWPDAKFGRTDIDTFWNEFYEHITTDATPAEVKALYDSKIIMDQEVYSFIKNLKKQYPLLAIANETKSGIKLKLDKFKLDKLFDKIYCSALLGMAKPNKDIYEFVLKNADIKAEESIYIDNQIENVEAAKELGFQAIHYQSLSQLKQDLSALGLTF
ncbi:HAD family phosphatase [archaeon]|nr:HAD family phosphatase [archaeon]MBL7056962.1 HAD family phosphatase [Candidatus Woesearchaeota archaeon]